MNQYTIEKSSLKGELTIPSSKSETLRAILFGTLGNNKSTIYNYLKADDTKSMIEACKLLGAKIDIHKSHLEIQGLNGKVEFADDVINAGNSGLVLRFCTCIAALSKNPIVITGDISIRNRRPMKEVLKGLSHLQVKAISTKGNDFAPLIIQGPILPGKVTINGEDSQPVSALLIASIFAEGVVELTVENPGEKPWVAMTLSWFDRLNIPYINLNYEKYQTFGPCRYEGFHFTVPGDLSSAAFPIAAAIITNSDLTVKNVDMDAMQGDKELIYVFQKMGALIEIDHENKSLHVKKDGKLSGITVDINDFIDSVTILAVVACYAEGKMHITNAKIAKNKESDRLSAITQELKKMGAQIDETSDGLLIQKSELKGATVFSHHDHRMCMSLTVAALGATGTTTITETACVSKTYPTFLSDFQSIEANIKDLSFGFSSTEILQNCGSDCQIFFEENSQSYFQEKEISADGPQDAEYQRVKTKTQVKG